MTGYRGDFNYGREFRKGNAIMTFKKVCTLDDVWEGEMESFEVDGQDILLVCAEGGVIKAFQGMCPHQDIPLAEGKFDGKTVICRAHLWQFDACSGKGINPSDCALAEYPVKIDGDDVLVQTEGVKPLFAHT
ncbi:Toluene-4-monooxygenase system protein C [Hydrogenophaga sp. T4]|nr:Toluene-4-monooxygenase system protein C [Hydrogenophaga sp. T4]